MEKIDAHVHVFAAQSDKYPRKVSAMAPPEREATAAQLLRLMDAAGIDRTVLIGYGGTGLEHHRYATHCTRQWPDRFTAAGLVDLDDADSPARLGQLVEATGIEGIRLRQGLGRAGAQRAQELKAYAVFQCAAELGLNINIYTSADQVAHVEMLVQAFPQVVVSLDHYGIAPSTPMQTDRWQRPHFGDEALPPATFGRIIDMAQYPNVHIKITGEYAFSKRPWPYPDMQPLAEAIYRAYGAERMMWGTDFPWIAEEPGYQRLAGLIDRHLPTASQREKDLIMGGTARRLWFKK